MRNNGEDKQFVLTIQNAYFSNIIIMEYVRYIQALIEEQKALGAVEEEVVSRYGHIPQLAPEAYNVYTFAPLTEERLALVEQNIGREIPCQYRTFLTHVSNGMHIFHRCLSLLGLQGEINRKLGAQGPFDLSIPNVYERPSNADASCFFIGGYSYDASKLYMKDDSDKVYYCARRDATPLKEWNSFSEMLIEEIQRLKSLHGADGMLQVAREETLPIA